MVERAQSAEQALILLEGKTPDLITIDIQLPGIDGWEFLTRCKQIPALKEVPMVIISFDVDQNKGWALGASLVLEKPVSMNCKTRRITLSKIIYST